MRTTATVAYCCVARQGDSTVLERACSHTFAHTWHDALAGRCCARGCGGARKRERCSVRVFLDKVLTGCLFAAQLVAGCERYKAG